MSYPPQAWPEHRVPPSSQPSRLAIAGAVFGLQMPVMFLVAAGFFYGSIGIGSLFPGDYCEHACAEGWGFVMLLLASGVWLVGIVVGTSVVALAVAKRPSWRRAFITLGLTAVGWWAICTTVVLAFWSTTSGGNVWGQGG